MFTMYFTEQPMSAYPAQTGLEFGATALMFSNKYFDPVAGSRLYNEYLEQYIYAEEMGVEGFMLNEHHNAPFCMQAKCNIFASILAAVTKKAKIVLLGNPLPLAENPVRLAEELAMIDMISKGRLVSGFVRGGGQEQLANGVNPAFNRERFEEAHDLVTKAWTTEGPFRWEGTHYQNRVVNPWAVPLQKPYPRVWIPGVLSKETIIWAAKQRYPYIALNTSIEATKAIWKLY
ncbi:MAG: LLM class flavin-dependent oxidoreductase, partial [Stellaceae bacterium]